MSEFLGEARVVIRPDTTRFRAELETQVAAATSRPITVPVTAQVTATTTAGQATAQAAAAQTAGVLKAQATATAQVSSATAELGRIQRLTAASANDLATAELRVLTASTALGAAQLRAAAAVRAAATQEEILAAAVSTGNAALIRAATLTTVLTRERQAQALATLAATRAENVHATSLGNVGKAATAGGAGLLGLRGAVLTAGTAFLGATIAFQAFVQSLQAAAQLETELNTFQVTAQATESQMQAVAAASRELGSDISLPGVAAQDAAEGLTALARAGLSVQDALDGIRGTLQLATAAQISNAEASELVANSLNAFNLAGDDATKIADLLAGASIEAQGSIADMGLALRQAAAAANLAGLSIEDTLTILTQLARAGLSSSDAGTSLRTALIRLIKPTEDVKQLLSDLRVEIFDVNGAVRAEAFGELGSALSQLTPEAQKAAVALLGGSDALRTFAILSRTGSADFERTALAIGEQGLAADLAAARTKGFAGQIENLKNQANTLATTLGTVLKPAAGGVADTLAGAFRGANLAVEGIRKLTDETRPAAGSLSDLRAEMEQAQDDLIAFSQNNGATAETVAVMRDRLDEAQDALDEFGVSAARARDGIDGFDIVVAGVTNTIGDLIEALEEASSFTASQRPDDEGLGVQQVLNRLQGFDSAETRARIRGNTDEILSVLQDEQDFLQTQLERDFVKRRPALQRQLENALFGATSDIASIAEQGASDAKSAAAEAARAVQEADQALLDLLGQRRDDAGRKIAAAAETAGVSDDIRRQDQLQALIKKQIQKVRDRIADEKTRKAAVRELRIALIASRAEEERLREEQKKAAAEQRTAAILERGAALELDIELADINENDKRRVALRRRRIAQLEREAKLLKLEGNALKENRNERARIRKEIEKILEEDKETDSSGRLSFEALQKQQGFVANLLGNLIPTNATAGLVGGSTTDRAAIPDIGKGIRGESAAATGRAQFGPSAGQTNSEIEILRSILLELRQLNNEAAHPEAKYERKAGTAVMDGIGGV